MKRILWPLASAVALLPATIGLVGNPSLSQGVPVQIPAHAQLSTSSQSSSPTSRPTDDPTHPGDGKDVEGADGKGVEGADDNGGTRGGHGADNPTPTPSARASTEDNGGSRHSSDDSTSGSGRDDSSGSGSGRGSEDSSGSGHQGSHH